MAKTRRRKNYAGELVRSKIVEFVENYYVTYGVPPTIGDIVEGVEEANSKSTVHHHLRVLVDEGKMRESRSGATARFIPSGYMIVRNDSNGQ